MKVCMVTEQYPPGVGGLGTATQRIARNLAKLGLDIHVIAPGSLSADAPVKPVWDEGVTVHYTYPALGGFFGDLVQLREIGDYILRLHQDIDFDLFHGLFLVPSGFVGAIAAKMVERPFIASIRGSDIERLSYSPLFLGSIRWVLEQASCVTSVNRDLLEKAKKIATFPKGYVIPNVFDPIVFDSGSLRDLIQDQKWRFRIFVEKFLQAKSRGGPVIGTIGNMRHVKGFGYLLSAFQELLVSYPDASLLLVGDFVEPGKKKQWLQHIKTLGLKKRFFITGSVPHAHVKAWLEEIDIVVLPSLYEGSPNALIEAMGCGRPFVATEVCGVVDIVTHLHEGFLVPPRDAEALTMGILSLLDDEALRRQLSNTAKKKAQNGLSPEKETEAWLEVYRNALEAQLHTSTQQIADNMPSEELITHVLKT